MGSSHSTSSSVSTSNWITRAYRDITSGSFHTKDRFDRSESSRNRNDAFTNATFIRDQKGKIDNHWNINRKKIGQGGYGMVVTATHKVTGFVRAVKQIGKAHVTNIERFRQEIHIMKMMDHPNVIRLYETYEDKLFIYLVMEWCPGGELFDRIIDCKKFTEPQAALIMKQILYGIFYMHSQGVMHRDLKPENFLFVEKDQPIEKSTIKIIDFGLSCTFNANSAPASTKAGTPYYVAPQVLQGSYGHEIDVWSVGVMQYILLCGYPPFHGNDDREVLDKVKAGKFSFHQKDWGNISDDAKDLITWMLKMDPKERATAQQALQHVWIVEKAPRAKGELALNTNLVLNLQKLKGRNTLQKAAIHVIAHQMDTQRIRKIKACFEEMDTDNNGQLSPEEIKAGLLKMGGKVPDDLKTLLEEMDSDGNGQIDFSEFCAAALDAKECQEKEVCWGAFNRFDLDGNGKISKEELRQVLSGNDENLKETFSNVSLKRIMKECDQDGDGQIDFQEFLAMMRSTNCGDAVSEAG